MSGAGDDRSFSPSVAVIDRHGKTICHSYVRNGQMQFLGDCDHALAGQTVDIPDWDEKFAKWSSQP